MTFSRGLNLKSAIFESLLILNQYDNLRVNKAYQRHIQVYIL